MSYWIDSHCHINDEIYQKDFDSYMQKAQERNVQISNVICLNYQQFLDTISLQERYHNLDISFGFFPEDAETVNDKDLIDLENSLDKIIAIGEIGLDYHYENTNKQAQKDLFIKQIQLANKYNKPIIIHSRDASQDTYDILKAYAHTRVLMHCFSESFEMMQRYQNLGYYISFSGIITFNNAVSPKNNASKVDLDKVLIETDCPYLTPVPFRGKTNETAYVSYVGEQLAKLKNIEIEQLQQLIMKNYFSFRGYDGKD